VSDREHQEKPTARVAFRENQWDALLSAIHSGAVIPVTGPDLLQLTCAGGSTTLYRRIAEILRNELFAEGLPPGTRSTTLQHVARAHQLNHGHPIELYERIYSALTGHQWPTPEPLQKLAAISGFDLYVSGTFDHLLRQAIDEIPGQTRCQGLAYSLISNFDDIPTPSRAPGTRLVYQLFGKVAALPDYVVTEDDLLRFGHRLTERDYRPKNLFRRLKTHSILLLGCNLPDWLTRFLFYATKGDDLFSVGARGVVAESKVHREPGLALFLERSRTSIYVDGSAVDFVNELYRRWMERYGGHAAGPPPPEPPGLPPLDSDGTFFISYANEDVACAERLARAMEERGLPVWFDRDRLCSGDEYWRHIKRYIERSEFFIPLITENTAAQERRAFRKEWNQALEERGKAPFDPETNHYILPLVCDDTETEAEFLGGVFAGLHWHRAKTDEQLREFVNHCEILLRKKRRLRKRLSE
jgi:hypothetical protein